ncbi:hypothetical protein [Gloeothece verrucosa]|uniref:hypothetical protein n=1 Tax=Gloeothece verrucosa TaxID=2546359 RepID=UPI0002E03855
MSGSADNTAKIWNIDTLSVERTFVSKTELIWAFYYSSKDEIILAAINQGDKIIVFDFLSGETLLTFRNVRLYENMRLTGVTGLTSATLTNLRTQGVS